MDITLTEEQTNALLAHLNGIYAIIGYAQGKAQSYEARRDQIKTINIEELRRQAQEKQEGNALTTPQEGQMKIFIPGVSMNSKPRKDGRFQGYVIRNGEKRYFYANEKDALEEKVRRYLLEVDSSTKKTEQQKKFPKFGEYVEKWLRLYKAPNLKPTSMESIRNTVRAALKRFSQKRIASITSDDLQEMLLEDVGGGNMRKRCLVTLNQIFKKAYNQGVIKRNPCDAVELAAYKSKKKSALTLSEQETFLSKTTETKYSLLYRFTLATGLRVGEALALLKSDIDFENHSVTVSKNVVFVNGERIDQACPKTDAANRTVPIPAPLCAEIEKLEGELIFPFTYNSVRIATEKTAKELKIKVSMHILRHTYATRLEEAGVPPKIKQYLMGHASLRMTQDVYTDAQKEYVSSVSDKIRDLFTPKMP